MTNNQHDLAVERTELAVKRTVLAVERNFSAWIRTALGSVAVGFAVVKLMSEGEPAWLVRALGVTFTIAGGAMAIMGMWRYHRESRDEEFRQHQVFPRWAMPAVAAMVIAGSFASLVLILLSSMRGAGGS
jgi:putative membrane protein